MKAALLVTMLICTALSVWAVEPQTPGNGRRLVAAHAPKPASPAIPAAHRGPVHPRSVGPPPIVMASKSALPVAPRGAGTVRLGGPAQSRAAAAAISGNALRRRP